MADREHCGCSDPGCSCCSGECHRVAESVLYRIDMDDATGTPMCEGCARDATDSGLFRREEIGDGGNLGAREIEIDGEVYEIDDVRELGWGHGGHFITSGRLEWNVFPSSEDAGKAARALLGGDGADGPRGVPVPCRRRDARRLGPGRVGGAGLGRGVESR